MKRTLYTLLCAVPALFACEDEIVCDSTLHPDQGAVVVTADWSGRSNEADIPSAYALRIGGEEQAASSATTVFRSLLAPGVYSLAVYNVPAHITFSGTTATVADSIAGYVHPAPGYLFAAHRDITVTADDTLRVTASMAQYVRRLDLRLIVAEGDYSRIASATAALGGIASAVDITRGQRLAARPSRASAAARTLTGLTLAGGTFTGFFRLLGIVPSETQALTVSLTFTNGDRWQATSDLTPVLRTFNQGIEPLTLTASLRLPVAGGAAGGITDWQQADGGNTDSH